jgi:hypothetical protein
MYDYNWIFNLINLGIKCMSNAFPTQTDMMPMFYDNFQILI